MNKPPPYSCLELAELKLPGYPTTDRGWRDLVDKESFDKEKRSGRGGGWVYFPPPKIQKLIDVCSETQGYTKKSEITLQLTVSLSEAEHILGWLRCNRNE